MSTYATLIQPSPRGDGAVVLEIVQAHIDRHIGVLSALPKGGAPTLLTVEGLAQLRNDLGYRAEMGKAKYGTYLRTNNGRSPLLDLYQEICDAIMYAQQGREEGDVDAGMYVELLIGIGQNLALKLQKNAA